MISVVRFLSAASPILLFLAACGDSAPEKRKVEDDPAVTGAIGDEILIDPELAGQQGDTDRSRIELPPEQRTPEAVAAIRAEARQIAGGIIQTAPAPAQGAMLKLLAQATTAVQMASAAGVGKPSCADELGYTARWATALPAVLAIYPQGSVQDAAGADLEGCRLRVVTFVTPASATEVTDFYYTRLRMGGYGIAHESEGRDHLLRGAKGTATYAVRARERADGLTEVDLIADGA